MIIRSLLVLMVVLVIAGCEGSSNNYRPDFEDPMAKTLDVDLYRQQTEVWCWAAVIEMVSSYYNNRALQCQTLQFWYNIDCCNFPTLCITTGSDLQIQNSLFALGINNQYVFSPITWFDYVNEIDNGRPIIIFYRGSFVGHVVVAFGYNSEKRTMFIHDPYYGTFEVPYGESFAYNGSMFWSQTMYGIEEFE